MVLRQKQLSVLMNSGRRVHVWKMKTHKHTHTQSWQEKGDKESELCYIHTGSNADSQNHGHEINWHETSEENILIFKFT